VLVSARYPGIFARIGLRDPGYLEPRDATVGTRGEGEVAAVPEGYFGQYVTIGIFAVVGVLLVAVTLQIARLLRPTVSYSEKYTTYESGIDPIGSGWQQANIRYYVFALLFVVFDVEAVFLFPWAIVFEELGTPAFVEMVIFIVILAIALLYAVKKKVLEWL
jgi:NADH-quinone oxidoreductase subunit A